MRNGLFALVLPGEIQGLLVLLVHRVEVLEEELARQEAAGEAAADHLGDQDQPRHDDTEHARTLSRSTRIPLPDSNDPVERTKGDRRRGDEDAAHDIGSDLQRTRQPEHREFKKDHADKGAEEAIDETDISHGFSP